METYDQQILLDKLVNMGALSYEQCQLIHAELRLGTKLIPHLQMVYGIDPWLIARVFAKTHNILYHPWSLDDIDISVADVIPPLQLKYFSCLPIQKKGTALSVVFSGMDSLELRTLLREHFPECTEQHLYLVPHTFLDQGLGLLPKDPQAIFKHLSGLDGWPLHEPSADDSSTDAILQIILNDAYRQRASDIHLEPHDGYVQVRLRIDCYLRVYRQLPIRHWGYLAARIKVLTGMNTAESRRPQSGRCQQALSGHPVDIRAASHPTTKGEAIVLRLLDKQKMVVPIDQLGFCDKSLHLLKKMYSMPQGLVLLTGPTGSGKTTTLYSILNQLNRGDTNIMTLEDPVEYELQGVRQTSVNPNVLSFKDGIRAILRQDPDVILIGEIRDEDTAHMAFRASQTGHLVFSTLHTNDVWGVFPRLMDFGISFNSIKHTLVGLTAQRLVRTRCDCFPNGCSKCNNTGFYGRTAIGEMLWITPELRQYLSPNDNLSIPNDSLDKHYISLSEAGTIAVNTHQTTIEEIKRYCGDIE